MKLTLTQKFTFVTVLLVASLGVTGFVNADLAPTQTDQVITYGMPYDFSEYSQYTSDSYATVQWVSAVMEGLYARDADNNRDYSPALAADDPTVSNDGLTWTVELKDNLKFATGNPLNASDVVFSYKASLTPSIDTYNYGVLATYFTNDSVVALDEKTVEFTLESPYAFAQGLLTLGIVERAEFIDDYEACIDGDAEACVWNDPSGDDARGAGPFFVDSIDTTNQIVTLTKNEHYWDADNVMASQLVFKKIAEAEAAISELGAGTIDIMDAQYVPGVDDFEGLEGVHEEFVGDPSHQEISLNHEHPMWGTGAGIPGNTEADAADALNVRKAMSHIVNRDNFVSEILDGLGTPAASSMPSASIGWLTNEELPPREYNVTLAREYMEAAGFDFANTDIDTSSSDSTCDTECFFEITILSPNTNPARNSWAAAYESELPKIGIGVDSHESVGWDIIIPRTFGNDENPGLYDDEGFDILFVGYGWDLSWDPGSMFDMETGSCSSGDCGNFMNYKNSTLANLTKTYAGELDFTKRIELVGDVQRAQHADIPVIPILYPQSHWGWSEDIEGLDALLISTSSAEWDEITKSGWTTAPSGETLDARGSGGGLVNLPVDSSYVIMSLVMTSMVAMVLRRRKN